MKADHKKMSYEDMKKEMGEPTPICLHISLENKVNWILGLSVANYVLLILFETVFK